MPPIIGKNDEFEGVYTEKFRSLAREHGEFVHYERDRAAIDLGVHLTNVTELGREVSQSRVWFQLKGVRSTTLSYQEYVRKSEISLPVSLDHLRFWSASPEPIYLVLYVECADKFLVEDARDIVDRMWGENFWGPDALRAGQQRVTVNLLKTAELSRATWAAMRRHRSMRIDGPLFHGRPLGHRLDPLRCSLNRFDPSAFCKLVGRLLQVHGYYKLQELNPAILFPPSSSGNEHSILMRGTLYYPFGNVPQSTTQFGIGSDIDSRIEGTPLYAQGPCAIFIHGDTRSRPDLEAVRDLADSLMKDGIRQLLVFANMHLDPAYFGSFFAGTRGSGLTCIPLFLGEVAYSLLTTPIVYLEFREAVSWGLLSYLWD